MNAGNGTAAGNSKRMMNALKEAEAYCSSERVNLDSAGAVKDT